jgi:hypothetical protein
VLKLRDETAHKNRQIAQRANRPAKTVLHKESFLSTKRKNAIKGIDQ